MTDSRLRLGILYEHPEWFRPLFAELDRRGVPYDRLPAAEFHYDPRARTSPYALVVNRMSPSAYLRGHGNGIFFVREFLRYLEEIGVPVINGAAAFAVEMSKATQLDIFERLGLRYPQARVVNHESQVPLAAQGLQYPVIVKPNIGGSGAKIQRFDERMQLVAAVHSGTLDLGMDHVALVQEFLPAREGAIVRVEVMGGRFLYAIRVYPTPGAGFNLCPADICQQENGEAERSEAAADPTLRAAAEGEGNRLAETAAPAGAFCPATASKQAMRIECCTPSRDIIEQVLRIAAEAKLDIGGIEYLVNERDGQAYFYDVNALSNFVTDAPNIVGFDPFPAFVDFLMERAARGQHAPAAAI